MWIINSKAINIQQQTILVTACVLSQSHRFIYSKHKNIFSRLSGKISLILNSCVLSVELRFLPIKPKFSKTPSIQNSMADSQNMPTKVDIEPNMGYNAGDSSGEKGICHHILYVMSIILVIMTFPVSMCACLKIVTEYQRAVIFRLGRCEGAKGPGLFFILPCMDDIFIVDLRTGQK